MVHRLDAPACGWPAGTELVATPRRRLARGDVVVAEELADPRRRLVGVHQVRFGRPFLLTDREAIWLGPGVAVLGVVTVVSPPLPETEALQAEVALAGAGSGRRHTGD